MSNVASIILEDKNKIAGKLITKYSVYVFLSTYALVSCAGRDLEGQESVEKCIVVFSGVPTHASVEDAVIQPWLTRNLG